MSRRVQSNTVHTVLYDDARFPGPAGDGTHSMRFWSLADAEAFAQGRTYYGRPARVTTENDVPDHVLRRWSVS